MIKISFTYIALIPILFMGVQCSPKMDNKDIMAKVGDTILTRKDVKSRMSKEGYPPDQERTYVDKWIHRELLYQEARRLHLDQSEDLQEELIRIEKEILINKLLERTYKEKIKISEEELRSYYEQNTSDFTLTEPEVRIQHMLLKTLSDANLALQEMNTGKSFENIAVARSLDAFASRGGEMGYIKKADVIPEIERTAFNLPKDQVSSIIRSSFGYHIIKVLDRRASGEIRPLAEVRPEIMQRLRVIKEGQVYYDLLYQLQNQNKYYILQQPEYTEPSDSAQADETITN